MMNTYSDIKFCAKFFVDIWGFDKKMPDARIKKYFSKFGKIDLSRALLTVFGTYFCKF